VGGPRLGPFDRRTKALACEARWLIVHWLPEPSFCEHPPPTPRPTHGPGARYSLTHYPDVSYAQQSPGLV
jgi:hypothetical protein